MTIPTAHLRAATDLVVWYPDPAPAPLAFAATELAHYLERLTGVRPSVRSHPALRGRGSLALAPSLVDRAFEAVSREEGPVVVPAADHLILTGRTPREALDATYALLAWWGCRWSPHGPSEEFVPRLDALPFPDDPLRVGRRFPVSGHAADLMTWHATEPALYADRVSEDRVLVDWMGKTGASRFFFIRHPGDDLLTIPELQVDLDRRGIDVDCGGHIIPRLLPRELFAAHPEYFPCGPDGVRTSNGNLCTASAGALGTASRAAVEWVRAQPEMAGLHLWGADLWNGGWCRCAACRASSAHDQSVRLCNAVARALAAAAVPRPVYYLAYHDTIDATLHVPPDPGVWVEFAPRERCFGHALDDPACATNRRYATALERYAAQFDGRVRIFEYYADAILFCGCAVPLTAVIEADLAYFVRLGVPEITMLQFGAMSRFAYPTNFVAYAAAAAGSVAVPEASRDYCRRFGLAAAAGAAALGEAERVMSGVVRYGDIRRPPSTATAAAETRRTLADAIAALGHVVDAIGSAPEAPVRDLVEILAYTRAVLAGVEAQCGEGIGAAAAVARYAEAGARARAWNRHTAGVWGAVDLPLLLEFYDVLFKGP